MKSEFQFDLFGEEASDEEEATDEEEVDWDLFA